MTITAHTNATLSQIAAKLMELDDFVICGHVNPDGDALGATLGLAAALRHAGKRVVALKPQQRPVGYLDFLPGADELVFAGDFTGQVGCFVGVDIPRLDRMGDEAAALCQRAAFSVMIDHHLQDEAGTDWVYADPDAAAASLIVWDLCEELGTSGFEDVATCCYVGLMTDTGRFSYSNTDLHAFEAAGRMVEAGAQPQECSKLVYEQRTLGALQLEARMLERMVVDLDAGLAMSWIDETDYADTQTDRTDAETLIVTLRSIKGVRAAAILKEQDGTIRASLRSKDGLDVAAIANTFGGGGHKEASGCTIDLPMAEAFDQLWQVLIEACRG